MEHLSNGDEDHPHQHENGHKLCDETKHPVLNENWGNHMIRIPNRVKAVVKQILALEEKNKSKRAGLWFTVMDVSRKVNHQSKVIVRYKNVSRVHQVYQFYQNRLANPYDDR